MCTPRSSTRWCCSAGACVSDLCEARCADLIEVLWPLHHGGIDDRIDSTLPPVLQAEDRAAVVEQVEFDVAAAADQLLLALGLAPGRREILSHQSGIDAQEGAADVLREGEGLVPVGFQIIVEDAADAARLVAVLEEEILVAPFLVFVVGRDFRRARRRPSSSRRERRCCRGRSGCAACRAPASGRRRRRTRLCW